MGIFCQVFKSELQTSLYGKSSFIFKNILKFVSANRLKYREVRGSLKYNTRGVNLKKNFLSQKYHQQSVCEIRLKLNVYHTLLNMFYLIKMLLCFLKEIKHFYNVLTVTAQLANRTSLNICKWVQLYIMGRSFQHFSWFNVFDIVLNQQNM